MKLLTVGLVFFFVFLTCLIAVSAESPVLVGASRKFVIGEESLAPWANGLLQFGPASGPSELENLGSQNKLVLAEKRTNRPDILDRFRRYRDGWDITNKHYWASVGYTGAAGFILASLWFVCFGIILAVHRCCQWPRNLKKKDPHFPQQICLALLILFTSAAVIGCILLSVGQDEFHGEVLHTLNFVVNQSDFTVQILKNVTEYLSLAKSIHVEQVFLSPDDKGEIDKLNVELNEAADVLTEKTSESSGKIRKALNTVRYSLIAVAAVMLLLALLGLLLSVLGHQHAMYIFILSGWLLVAVTFILCGVFVILSNTISDTCVAMDEWVQNPQAETALSNILPCVDESTTNRTLYQSKEVILQLVNVVNTAIYSIANSNSPQGIAFYYNQSGPLMPPLCPPFDSQLHDRQCQEPWEVSFANASMVWQNYTCQVSPSGVCISTGRVTPDIYSQLAGAVNVSYALLHYGPLVLSLQDCNFVRDTFTTITTLYCSPLGRYLKLVNAGLALISVGVMLCLLLWIVYANHPLPREEVFVKQVSVPKATDTASNRPSVGNGEESC
ncbi:uncharacterized protein [Aristolochia californica]|uniref:uncharacterized protein isoform X2 n=1 Tax=Aristolochia californica TaxID=171875 RepID=UPI0035E1C2F2